MKACFHIFRVTEVYLWYNS